MSHVRHASRTFLIIWILLHDDKCASCVHLSQTCFSVSVQCDSVSSHDIDIVTLHSHIFVNMLLMCMCNKTLSSPMTQTYSCCTSVCACVLLHAYTPSGVLLLVMRSCACVRMCASCFTMSHLLSDHISTNTSSSLACLALTRKTSCL